MVIQTMMMAIIMAILEDGDGDPDDDGDLDKVHKEIGP